MFFFEFGLWLGGEIGLEVITLACVDLFLSFVDEMFGDVCLFLWVVFVDKLVYEGIFFVCLSLIFWFDGVVGVDFMDEIF